SCKILYTQLGSFSMKMAEKNTQLGSFLLCSPSEGRRRDGEFWTASHRLAGKIWMDSERVGEAHRTARTASAQDRAGAAEAYRGRHDYPTRPSFGMQCGLSPWLESRRRSRTPLYDTLIGCCMISVPTTGSPCVQTTRAGESPAHAVQLLKISWR